MAKFMLIKIGLMAEITDADTLREAALKNFDDADSTSTDHPETADWHALEEGQEGRRLIATEGKVALHELLGGPLLPLLPLLRPAPRWFTRCRALTNWRGPRSARPATPGRTARGLHRGPTFLSRLTDAKHPEIATAL
jgi:hypothetical protein